jgi:hypothetical protein
MKLYRTDFIDDAYTPPPVSVNSEGTYRLSAWTGTQADATACRKTLLLEGMRDIKTYEVDVPTSKSPLIEWLNDNVIGKEI